MNSTVEELLTISKFVYNFWSTKNDLSNGSFWLKQKLFISWHLSLSGFLIPDMSMEVVVGLDFSLKICV